jgi:hypothetical protein
MDGVLPQHNANNDTVSAKIPERQAQDIVTISFTGRLASKSSPSVSSPPSSHCRGEEMGPIFQVASRWTIVIGDRDVVNAVEMGVRFMTHQTARVYSHAKFALGPGTRTWGIGGGSSGGGEITVQPNANVYYDITIDDIVTTVDDRRLLEVARTRKMIGNDIFRHEHISQHEFAKQRALQQYKKAIAVLESLLQSKTATEAEVEAVSSFGRGDDDDDAFRAEVWQCLLDCRNNIAAVHLSCHDYHAAKLACIETLQLDPANGTALVRAAKACLYDPSSSFVEASAALRSAQDVLRDDDDAALLQSLRRQLHQRRAVHKARERQMANKMARGVTAARGPGNDDVSTTLALPNAGGSRHQRQKTDQQRRWPLSSLSSSWMIVVVVPVVGILLAVLVPFLIASYHKIYYRP